MEAAHDLNHLRQIEAVLKGAGARFAREKTR
jgi:hypothetical protein